MQKNSVYRHFSNSGELLYVGISTNPFRRLEEHKHRSKWFDLVSLVTIEHCKTRQQAVVAEAKAIKQEKPKYNIMMNLPEREVSSKKIVTYLEKEAMRHNEMLTEANLIMAIYEYLPQDKKEDFLSCNFETWKLENQEIVALLNAVKPSKGTKAIKDMSEQSYRNWKSKGFKGYVIPDLGSIIEVNQDENK